MRNIKLIDYEKGNHLVINSIFLRVFTFFRNARSDYYIGNEVPSKQLGLTVFDIS